jgi:hypothetical protein
LIQNSGQGIEIAGGILVLMIPIVAFAMFLATLYCVLLPSPLPIVREYHWPDR